MTQPENDEKLEALLKSQKLKSPPDHLMEGFTKDVMQRLEPKRVRLPKFEWRLTPTLAPAFAMLMIVAVTAFSYWQWSDLDQKKQTIYVATTQEITLEESIQLVQEFEDAETELYWELVTEDDSLLSEAINVLI